MDAVLSSSGRIITERDYEIEKEIKKYKIENPNPGIFSLKYARNKIRRKAKIIGAVAQLVRAYSYFITVTFPKHYFSLAEKETIDGLLVEPIIKLGSINDKYSRKKAFDLVLKSLRNKKDLIGFVWVTELHKSGELHFHIVVSFQNYWNYKKWALERSLLLGSTNAIDVERVYKYRYWDYLAKYLAKDVQEDNILYKGVDFHLWGGSQTRKKIKVNFSELVSYYCLKYDEYCNTFIEDMNNLYPIFIKKVNIAKKVSKLLIERYLKITEKVYLEHLLIKT